MYNILIGHENDMVKLIKVVPTLKKAIHYLRATAKLMYPKACDFEYIKVYTLNSENRETTFEMKTIFKGSLNNGKLWIDNWQGKIHHI